MKRVKEIQLCQRVNGSSYLCWGTSPGRSTGEPQFMGLAEKISWEGGWHQLYAHTVIDNNVFSEIKAESKARFISFVRNEPVIHV